MSNVSLKTNGILNVIRSLLKVIFPLITYKYVAVILGVENIGRYNFSLSVVSYFAFIAALGINAYSIRSGVFFRDNKEKMEEFASQIFSINMLATLIAYIIMGVLILFSQSIRNYVDLIMILSLQIAFATIGVEWLYSIYEDYLYITIRTFLTQIIALILLFVVVKKENDTVIYALITVISSVGTNVANFFYSRKFCKVSFTLHLNLKTHILPILVIFAQNVSVLIYVNSDIILLGLMSGDYYTGVYTIATNIYKGIKTVLTALIVVSIPRLSYHWGRGENVEFENVLKKLFSAIMTFVFPIIIGVIILSKEMILFLADPSYLDATISLRLLGIATLFCVLSYIYGQCILIPMHKEMILLKATIFSAVINIVLNFVAIPILQQNGAALTTIIAEAFVFTYIWIYIHKKIKICEEPSMLIKPLLGSAIVGFVCMLTKIYFSNYIIILMISVFLSGIVYFLFELLIGNEIIRAISEKILGRK